ncbi:MAG TPA: YjfB family protein [Pantanalinema sp.]
MSSPVSNSTIAAASTPGGAARYVGVSVLKKQMDFNEQQNAQLLSSIPQAPRPGGSQIDLYV